MGKFVLCWAVLLMLCTTSPAAADEGMWTLNNFPAEKVAKAYGFKPGPAWLDHVQHSALRLASGCSASFVSANGLVQTNHHCAHRCIEQLSTADKDFVATGFLAKRMEDEVKCPTIEANQLLSMTDVTARIRTAVAGKDGKEYATALKAIKATIAQECSHGDDSLRCDVVELYHGGLYDLYQYRRYQDVRLVFAPEMAIAFFGGDPDNFEFPRYDLDVSFLRVYDEGKPLDTTANFFPYAKQDVKPGDLTFTAGHPGSTNRLDTVAQLEYRRDVVLPRALFDLSELRGVLTEFSTKGTEQARIANDLLFSTENSLKALKGQFAALLDPAIIGQQAASEKALRAKLDAHPDWKADYGTAWTNIAATLDNYRPKRDRYVFTEGGLGFRSQLFSMAKAIVRHQEERQKPDQQRLGEYTESNFPALRQTITSNRPIYPELETLTLSFSLTKLREAFGPDDPFVKMVLGDQSPAQRAAELIGKTGLADAGLRKKLLEGDPAAVLSSDDPLIILARAVDPEMRAVRKDFEDNYDAPLVKFSGQVAAAKFKVYGASTYPDATFTLRLSYGAVEGSRERSGLVSPITTLGGLFDRATGADPFKLPPSWTAARAGLDMGQALNFASTNDIIGGNSGSPVIDKAGQVVGLIFDGNRASLGGSFGYDQSTNRAVSVSVGAIREALTKVYHAERLVEELSRQP